MTAPTTPPAWRRCWPLTLVVSIFMTCVIVPMCLFGVLQVNAGYWFLLHNAVGFEPRPAQAQAASPVELVTPAGDDPVSVGAAVFANNGCAACRRLPQARCSSARRWPASRLAPARLCRGQSAEDYLRASIVGV